MILPVHFVFLPSDSLVAAASQANEMGIVSASVWTSRENDRTGLAHSQQELEQAFWADFQANLIYDDETEVQRSFRSLCLHLGFSKCWTVVKTGFGGPAEDLLKSGREAIAFLESQRPADEDVA